MKKKCTFVLISVLTVACIVSAYLLFFYNPSFNMVYDSDTDSYFNNSYLSYNDGRKFTVKSLLSTIMSSLSDTALHLKLNEIVHFNRIFKRKFL